MVHAFEVVKNCQRKCRKHMMNASKVVLLKRGKRCIHERLKLLSTWAGGEHGDYGKPVCPFELVALLKC